VPGKLALELFDSINLPDAPAGVSVSLSLARGLSLAPSRPLPLFHSADAAPLSK